MFKKKDISSTQDKLLKKNTKIFINTINKYDNFTLLYMRDCIDKLLKERKKKNVR